MQTAESIQLKRKKVEKQDVFYCWVIKARKCTSWIWDPFGRDCVAYTIPIKSPYGSKLPTAFFSGLCTYLSNAKFLVPMRLGDTPVPIPNTTVKTQSADGTALETVWESRWAPDQKKKNRETWWDRCWFYQWSERKSYFPFRWLIKHQSALYLENCIHEIWLS